MVIKFTINQEIEIFGKTEAECDFSFKYTYLKNSVEVTSEGELSKDKPGLPSIPYHYAVKKINYEITLGKKFKNLDQSALLKIASVAVDTHNNLLRRLRQFGGGKHLNYLRVDKDNLNAQLDSWNFKFLEGGKELKVLEKPTLIELLYLGYMRSYHPFINATSLSVVNEALVEDLPELPDNEIKTKAEEFIDKEEYRLALLEAVMCLETVLNRYITVYCDNSSKKLITEPNTLKDFPVPLKTKLSVVLDHYIHPTYYKGIKVANVFSAINTRNKVVHAGTVDVELKYPNIKEWIVDTIKLCDALIRSGEQVNYTPLKTEIADEFDAIYHKKPTIWVYKTHSYIFEIISFDKFSETEMQGMSEKLSEIVKAKDPKFDPAKNLTVNFKYFLGNKVLGIWDRGKLVVESAEDYIGSAARD